MSLLGIGCHELVIVHKDQHQPGRLRPGCAAAFGHVAEAVVEGVEVAAVVVREALPGGDVVVQPVRVGPGCGVQDNCTSAVVRQPVQRFLQLVSIPTPSTIVAPSIGRAELALSTGAGATPRSSR